MDTIGLIVGLFVLISGVILGYLFSPRHSLKQKDPKVAPEIIGNIQKSEGKPFTSTLSKITKISHDTYIFTYDLPHADLPLGLHVGQHIFIHAHIPTKEFPQGEDIKRKYTPISNIDQRGTFEVLIKVYRRDSHPRFPDGGILSQYLETLKLGDKITVSGPLGKLSYHGNGNTIIRNKEDSRHTKVRNFGLVCGGTGIAPMYQIIKAILDNSNDQTNVHLLFGNKSEEDILVRPELEGFASDPRIKVFFTIDVGTPSWKGFTGFVTKEMLQKTMPAAGKDTLICTCGPGPMNKMLLTQLIELGYPEDSIFKF